MQVNKTMTPILVKVLTQRLVLRAHMEATYKGGRMARHPLRQQMTQVGAIAGEIIRGELVIPGVARTRLRAVVATLPELTTEKARGHARKTHIRQLMLASAFAHEAGRDPRGEANKFNGFNGAANTFLMTLFGGSTFDVIEDRLPRLIATGSRLFPDLFPKNSAPVEE